MDAFASEVGLWIVSSFKCIHRGSLQSVSLFPVDIA